MLKGFWEVQKCVLGSATSCVELALQHWWTNSKFIVFSALLLPLEISHWLWFGPVCCSTGQVYSSICLYGWSFTETWSRFGNFQTTVAMLRSCDGIFGPQCLNYLFTGTLQKGKSQSLFFFSTMCQCLDDKWLMNISRCEMIKEKMTCGKFSLNEQII